MHQEILFFQNPCPKFLFHNFCRNNAPLDMYLSTSQCADQSNPAPNTYLIYHATRPKQRQNQMVFYKNIGPYLYLHYFFFFKIILMQSYINNKMHKTFFLIRFDFSTIHLYNCLFFVYQNCNCNYLIGAFFCTNQTVTILFIRSIKVLATPQLYLSSVCLHPLRQHRHRLLDERTRHLLYHPIRWLNELLAYHKRRRYRLHDLA